MDANLAAVIGTQDAVILGRRSYDEWAGFWPGSEIEPFATFINGVTKYVATSTPLDPEWSNTTAVDGELIDFVRGLKDQPGRDIGIHASISVTQALLAAAVVDELRLVIAPTIAGSGRRLFEGLPPVRLEAIRKHDVTQRASPCRLPGHSLARSSRSARTRRSISSTILRTVSRSCPFGSSSGQSSYLAPR